MVKLGDKRGKTEVIYIFVCVCVCIYMVSMAAVTYNYEPTNQSTAGCDADTLYMQLLFPVLLFVVPDLVSK